MSEPAKQPLSENQRIGKQMLAVVKAAQQSSNPVYVKAALRWQRRIESQLKRDSEKEAA